MRTESEARLVNRRARCEFLNELAHRRTRQGAFDARCLHFGHPLPGGGRILEPSDGGEGAARIYAAAEVVPLWRIIWQRQRRVLTPRQRRVLDALLVDWRSRSAARIARVDHKTVDACKTFFKVHFSRSHTAWKRDCGV